MIAVAEGKVAGADRSVDDRSAALYWRSLRYFTIYRLVVAGLLLAALFIPNYGFHFDSPAVREDFVLIGVSYLLLVAGGGAVAWRWHRAFNQQLTLIVAIDVLAFTALMALSGGVSGGVGVLLLVALAGAGLVGKGRLVLFYAAVASLAVLTQQVFVSLRTSFDEANFFNAGLFSAGFFATAITARLLASRVVANEELARRRGLELQRESAVSEMVISQMHDGVLVASGSALIRQGNPRAWQFLGVEPEGLRSLAAVAPGLAQSFLNWLNHGGAAECEFRSRGEGRQIHARFVSTGSGQADTLIFLEDVGQYRQQAQQLKLAALGRLTASIAHEIRNPLNAIRQSAELLAEETVQDEEQAMNARLLKIMLDNTARLERIVQDVLELGRRDRVQRETLMLDRFLPELIRELPLPKEISPVVCQLDVPAGASLAFDRAHLRQVLRNLIENAIRHSRGLGGSVVVRVVVRPENTSIDIIDDGAGIPEGVAGQVFEPFFTTHAKGTGLGLFIARELCEANSAQLQYLGNNPGAHFSINGVAR